MDEIGDLLDQIALAALLDHVGQLGDDDRLLALPDRLDVRARLHSDPAAPGLVGLADPGAAEDDPAGRKVRPLDVPHQPLDADLGVVDVRDHGRDRLTKVVRRDVRRHPDGDPGGAVDQQVRVARRKHQRLLLAPVVVGDEIDRVLIDVAQHLGRDPRQARLGVAHRGRGVVVDRAEVALPVREQVAHREILRQPHQRVVDRRVAVRVVVAHHGADDR